MIPPAFLGRIIYFFTKPFILLILKGSIRSYVLVCYRDEVIITMNWLGEQDKWRLPGGGIKKNEDPTDNAKFEYYLYSINLASKPTLNIDKKEILQAKFVKISDIKDLELSDELQIAIDSLT